MLSRSPERQEAFTKLLSEQQDPGSPSYHQWLTPQQIGDLYGPTQDDLAALTSWLTSQCLSITEVAPSGLFITAAGTTATVGAALGTSFHNFAYEGGLRRAVVENPQIPSALTPIVVSISGLAKPNLRPLHQESPSVRAQMTGQVAPNYSDGTQKAITPGDFATIFDINPLYQATSPINGTGQKIAIIGRSRVAASDVSLFESKTALPEKQPNTIVAAGGADPGIAPYAEGDQGEAILDVDRVIGTAPGAEADLLISGSVGNLDGIQIAIQHEVQTLLDPIMSISFGQCEADATSLILYYDTLFAQAAAEGISVFVSSGDSGASGCTDRLTIPSVNYLCVSAYVTCVGGTEFAAATNNATYWSSANSTGLTSALSYIPEGAWNDTVAQRAPEGTGGGASLYIAKPSWQKGTGVPADNLRHVPDVSFPSSPSQGYLLCLQEAGDDCSTTDKVYILGGTSAAAPGMAGVAALLNQRLGSAQGNLNPLLYQLAASTPAAFHDVTPASSGVAYCSVSTPSLCNNTTLLGGTGAVGYAVTTGYDQATGLGSLDVARFVAAAVSATGAAPQLAAVSVALTRSASTIAPGTAVTFTAKLSSTTSGQPTGTVQFYADGKAIGSAAVASGTAVLTVNTLTRGIYFISSVYSGDKVFNAASSANVEVIAGYTPTLSVMAPAMPAVGNDTFVVTVVPGIGSLIPTGTVTLSLDGPAPVTSAATALVNGKASVTLPVRYIGGYTLQTAYSGDANFFNATASTSVAVGSKLNTLTTIQSSVNSVSLGGSILYTAIVNTGTGGVVSVIPPTGTVQFTVNGAKVGSSVTVQADGDNGYAQTMLPFPAAGSYTVSAIYSGDLINNGSTAPSHSATVNSLPASYTLRASPSALTFVAGAAVGSAGTLYLTETGGFAGTVTLGCKVTTSITTNALPTCSLSSSSVTLNADFAPTVATNFTIGSTLRAGESGPPAAPWKRSFPMVFAACLACFLPRRRPGGSVSVLVLLLLIGLTVTFSGCGGASGGGSSTASSSTTGTGTGPGTGGGTTTGSTAGAYTVTITPTSSVAGTAVPSPITITLNVQ